LAASEQPAVMIVSEQSAERTAFELSAAAIVSEQPAARTAFEQPERMFVPNYCCPKDGYKTEPVVKMSCRTETENSCPDCRRCFCSAGQTPVPPLSITPPITAKK